jgi:hypothetical protein
MIFVILTLPKNRYRTTLLAAKQTKYLIGRVKTDYLDDQESDIIATERRRVDWQDPIATHLLTCGKRE